MKAIIEVEISGEFEEPLRNDDIIDILNFVICDGARAGHMDANYRIIEMIKEDE